MSVLRVMLDLFERMFEHLCLVVGRGKRLTTRPAGFPTADSSRTRRFRRKEASDVNRHRLPDPHPWPAPRPKGIPVRYVTLGRGTTWPGACRDTGCAAGDRAGAALRRGVPGRLACGR